VEAGDVVPAAVLVLAALADLEAVEAEHKIN
jgi:hypothetical protein